MPHLGPSKRTRTLDEKQLSSSQKIQHILKKLGDLADILNEISRKMRVAADEQKQGLRDLSQIGDSLTKAGSEPPARPLPLSKRQLRRAQEVSRKPVQVHGPVGGKMTYGEYLEFTSMEEFRRFQTLPRITKEEVRNCDWDALEQSLRESSGSEEPGRPAPPAPDPKT